MANTYKRMKLNMKYKINVLFCVIFLYKPPSSDTVYQNQTSSRKYNQ